MLTYLINVTDDLLAVSVALGAICTMVERYGAKRGRAAFWAALALGALAAAIRAYITNTHRLTAGWRVGAFGYLIAVALFLVFAVVMIILGRRFFRAPQDRSGVARTIVSAVCGAWAAAQLYIALPTVLVYPFQFDTGGNGLLSTDYLFRLGGYALGLIVCVVSAVCALHLGRVCYQKGMKTASTAAALALVLLMSVNSFARLMSVLTIRRSAIQTLQPFGFVMGLIDPGQAHNTALFNFASFSNNNAHWYTFIAFIALALLTAMVFVGSRTAREPYATKAENRKHRALWRSGRRYGVTAMLCFVMAILCATWFVKLNTVVINVAPVEDPVIIKDDAGNDVSLFVPFEMVSDGHLHRFGYTTPDGNPARFIVVLKQPGTNNYGIGLDACEICGEAGYYENNEGRIVCKKCNVVMNTTTIGMKGGCNPIIIDYDMDENGITVPVSEMIANQSHFKK